MHPYYPHGLYASNVIEIADSAFSTLQPTTSIHHTEPYSADSIYKKRKIERACDACRRRKTKCDGPRMPDNICTNCIQNRKTCTYVEASKPRGPPKAYITSLEDRLEKMEALLRRLRPEADFSEDLGAPVIRDSWKTDLDPPHSPPHEKSTSPSASSKTKDSPSRSLEHSAANHPTHARSHSRRFPGTPRSDDTDLSSDDRTSSESDEIGELSISRGMKRLTIRGLEPTHDHHPLADNQVRFHGKSSFFKLIEPTRKLRDQHVNRLTGGEERSRDSRDSNSPINAAALRRPEFWTTPPWELAFEGYQDQSEGLSRSLVENLPPPDLADSLIKLYFENTNPFSPLFHRPTFERQWKEGLQYKDAWFGRLCLSVFAVSSRWSHDPRVLDDSKYDIPRAGRPSEEHKWQRAGWKFFKAAVNLHHGSTSLFHPAGLFEVQTMALLGMFLRGTAFHPVAWLFLSTGLRKAQDVGAHRKKIYGDKPTIEGELWKRAFWVLVLHDRMVSAALGRPCCSGEEEFDAELPLEVDDEYWEAEDPESAFQQPPGKPPRIAAFNSLLKLTKIVAYALRTIYALDRSKLLSSAARPRWPEVLAQLNHLMTEWVDSVPKHLHWSPHIEDPLFSNQSATLYIIYYVIQIIIYRPFLPPSFHSVVNITPRCNMPTPCIAVCVNASKCVSRILNAQIIRGFSNTPCLILGAHVCAAILLMNFWDLKWQERDQMRCSGFEDVKSPLALAMTELLDEISVFIKALESVKPCWRNAEMYLSDISCSLPQCLGGIEPSDSKNDPRYPPGVDDRAYYNAAPPDYTTLGDCRSSPPEYRTVSSPTDKHAYDSQNNASEYRPHFFEFPITARHPIPISSLTASCRNEQPMSTQNTILQPRSHDGLFMHSEPNPRGRRSSMSSFHSRPTSLFDEGIMNKAPTTQPGPFSSRQYAAAGRASYGESVSVVAPQDTVSNFGSKHTKLGWTSDWNFNPAHASRPSPDDATIQLGRLLRDKNRSSDDQVLPPPGHY